MSKHKHLMMLWNYMELSEKKRLMYKFAQKHGDHFTRYEFFEFLAEEYDDSQIEFETVDGEPVNKKVAA